MSDLDNMITYLETAFENAHREIGPYTQDIINKEERNSRCGHPLLRESLTKEELKNELDHVRKKQNRDTILRLNKILKQVLEFE